VNVGSAHRLTLSVCLRVRASSQPPFSSLTAPAAVGVGLWHPACITLLKESCKGKKEADGCLLRHSPFIPFVGKGTAFKREREHRYGV